MDILGSDLLDKQRVCYSGAICRLANFVAARPTGPACQHSQGELQEQQTVPVLTSPRRCTIEIAQEGNIDNGVLYLA